MNVVRICLAGYVSGLLLATVYSSSLIALLLATGFLCLACTFSATCKRFTRILLFFSFALLVGFVRYPLNLNPPDATSLPESFLSQGKLQVSGIVDAVSERPDERFGINLRQVVVKGEDSEAHALGRLRLYLEHSEFPPVIGSQVVFRSKVRRTRNFATPGEFDFVRHLAYQRIWYSSFLANARGLAILPPSDAGTMFRVSNLRQVGFELIEHLPHMDAVLLKALLLGEKGAMPRELRKELAAGGISHLFAISGLHLGLLSLLLYGVLRFVYCRSTRLLMWQPPGRVLWLLITPTLFGYLLLTGDALATRRAFFVLTCVVVLSLWRRRIDPLQLLLTLALLFLLVEPLALWQPSFLLSFSGAAGILLWHSPLVRATKDYPRYVRAPLQLFCISFAAIVATLPFVLSQFHLFAPAGLLNNLFAVPLVGCIALPVGLMGLLVGSFAPVAGIFLLKISAVVLGFVLNLSHWTANLPGATARAVFCSPVEILAVILICLSLLLCLRRWRALLLIPPALILLAMSPAVDTKPEVVMFSVGQGEATLLRWKGRNLLVDGGGLRSDSFDVGERLIAPALGYLGVKRLDAVILTHNHPDHSGGLAFIVENFPVDEFWSHASVSLPRELEVALRQRQIPLKTYGQSVWRQVSVGGLDDIYLYTADLKQAHENDRSLCLYWRAPSGGVLLTGDVEAPAVRKMLEQPLPGAVRLLKAPHHGSAGSLPFDLLSRLRPDHVFVSAGYANVYHFPSENLIGAARQFGASLWRTDLDGTLVASGEGADWQIAGWRQGLFR